MAKDNIVPKGKWRFNEDVAKVFTDMLERSIPNYETMRQLTYLLARNFIVNGTCIVDMGCSNGLSAEKIMSHVNDCKIFLFDKSEPMLTECRKKYQSQLDTGHLFIENRDAVDDWGLDNRCSLIQSILTLQFIPKDKREEVINHVYNSLLPGGAFFLVEKVKCSGDTLEKVVSSEYYEMKHSHAYTEEQIAEKRKSLKGVLEPLQVWQNFSILRKAGFTEVETYWRYLNFVGILAVKR